MPTIRELFANSIDRSIDGVIKADDDRHLSLEVEEYVITKEIHPRLEKLLESYIDSDATNGAWISGFFGSGKSHLLKMLSLLLEDREFDGNRVSAIFEEKTDDEFLRGKIADAAKIPSKSILFNVDQKADTIGGNPNSALLGVFAKVLNEVQGYYAKQDYIAQFECDLDQKGKLEAFKETYREVSGRAWEEDLDDIDTLENDTFAKAYAEFFGKSEGEGLQFFDRAREKYKLSVEEFAQRVKAFLDKQEPGFRLNFFVDEIGQFIGKNSRLMLNLQTIAETLATVCDGRAWVFVTSQGDLKTVLGDLQDTEGADFSKIEGRFAERITLSSADVAEVIQRRLLAKDPSEPQELVKLFNEEESNLKTLTSFRDGSRAYKFFSDTEHFCKFYPFLPYQFELCQTAIERLSQHDAFTGKHASVGERSMLAIFHEVVKKVADAKPGAFATFDLMFEGLKSVLRGDFQRSVLTAESNLNADHPLAVRILKCLFLLKWVTEFKPSAHNVAILLIDHANVDIAAHDKRVREELNYLESQSFLQRNGEIYEFLTDEEKDVEVEIKNTEIDDSKVPTILSDILFKDTLGDPKLRYEDNKHDYPYTRKLDDAVYGREHDLAVHLVTPLHPNSGDRATISAQNTGRRELVIALPSDNRLLVELRTLLQTERYIAQAQSTNLSETRRAILRDRGTQNTIRRRELKERCQELLSKATFILNGSELEVAGNDPKVRLHNAFQELVRFVYPNLRMLRTQFTEVMIADILGEDDDLLAAGESLSEGEQEIMTRLQRAKLGSERVHITDLLLHFQGGQYGWYEAATLCLIARLFRRHKVELRQAADILSNEEVLNALTNSRVQGSISVQMQEEFNASTIAALKSFHHDFFHQANPGNDAKSVAGAVLDGFRKVAGELETILAQESSFPFVSQLKPLHDRISKLSEKDYTYPLRSLSEFEDDLLTAREDLLDPVTAFINGAQGKTFVEISDFLRDQSGNLPSNDERAATLRELVASASPFRGDLMRRATAAFDAVRQEVAKRLEEARTQALSEIETREKTIRDDARFADLEEEQSTSILSASQSAMEKVRNAKLIPVIRDAVRNYTENEFPGQLSALTPPPAPSGSSGGSPDPAPEPSYVPLRDLMTEAAAGKPILQSESDVQAFVSTLEEKLRAAVSEGKGITL